MHADYTRAVQRATEKELRLQAEIKCVRLPSSLSSSVKHSTSMLLDSALAASPPPQLQPTPQTTTPTPPTHAQLLLSPSTTTTQLVPTTAPPPGRALTPPAYAAHTNGHAPSHSHNNHPFDRDVSVSAHT
jgi:hypothetical protein